MFLQNVHIGQNKWWQYLLTVVVVVAGALIGQIPLAIIFATRAANYGLAAEEISEMADTLDMNAIGIDNNGTLLLAILAFAFALWALYLGVQVIHRKPFRILITPAERINWSKIFFGFWLWMGLTVAAEIVFYLLDPGNYSFQFDPGKFFALFLIAVFLLPLQTSFEELLFRGYMMQGLSLISRYRWIPLLITSVAFGALHFINPEVAEFGLGAMMTYYIGVGLFLGIITLLDDSLELALGIHAATNIYGALFVTFDSSALPTAALFKMASVNITWMLIAFFVAAGVFFLLAKKKYGWHDWTKVYGIIRKPNDETPEALVDQTV
jgi:hypothetical protein